MYKIVCVEDDKILAQELKTALSRFDFDVYLVEDFEHVDAFVKEVSPHLVLLDVNLPYHNGFHWCERIRLFSHVPILFVSSRDERLDQVIAMTLGGDDYLTKPLDLDLTLVKIQALLRRSYAYEMEQTSSLYYLNIKLDLKTMVVSFDVNTIDLTKNEFKIMQCLMQDPETFVSRTKIMDFLWDHESFIDDNALNVNLSRLRKKLEQLVGQDMIETKRGVGYRVYIQRT